MSSILLMGIGFMWSFNRLKKEDLGKSGGHGGSRMSELFAISHECSPCHAYDPNQVASVDDQLNDINVVDDWEATMMANSAKDPFWQAKVSHEILVDPAHQIEIEDKCTACHAPMGHFTAKHNGQSHYSFSQMLSDSLAMDGVSCSACHQLDPNYLGVEYSGELIYDTNRIIWGPYPNAFSAPMLTIVGFDAQHGPHVGRSEMCASCHTLITPTTDLSGNYTGDGFVEQATYHEWLNSEYSNAVGGKTCQNCHMPAVNDEVLLSSDHTFAFRRTPFSKHYLVGGNSFMLGLLKDNIDSLDVLASEQDFDQAIDQTLIMLQDSSQLLTCVETNRTSDTAFYEVGIENWAGHKLPSGYPSRRMFLRFVVLDSIGDTLFQSGNWDASYNLLGHDSIYEPHYNMINDPNQVQIYEMVFGDVNMNQTTILGRGFQPLKDNRIPPKGFTSSHYAYDTTIIAGLALNDPNFNHDGVEGSGKDILNYHIPMNGYQGNLNVICRTYYQAAPPRWMDEMFSHSSYEIDRFKNMYNSADGTPVLMQQVLLGDIFTGLEEQEKLSLNIYPNPSKGQLNIEGIAESEIQSIEVYDMRGNLIKQLPHKKQHVLSLASGNYLIHIQTKKGSKTQRWIVH